jgi:hypothetical protein
MSEDTSRARHAVSAARLALEPVAQLLLLVLDEPADHLPPQRLDEVRRQPFSAARARTLSNTCWLRQGTLASWPASSLSCQARST